MRVCQVQRLGWGVGGTTLSSFTSLHNIQYDFFFPVSNMRLTDRRLLLWHMQKLLTPETTRQGGERVTHDSSPAWSISSSPLTCLSGDEGIEFTLNNKFWTHFTVIQEQAVYINLNYKQLDWIPYNTGTTPCRIVHFPAEHIKISSFQAERVKQTAAISGGGGGGRQAHAK